MAFDFRDASVACFLSPLSLFFASNLVSEIRQSSLSLSPLSSLLFHNLQSSLRCDFRHSRNVKMLHCVSATSPQEPSIMDCCFQGCRRLSPATVQLLEMCFVLVTLSTVFCWFHHWEHCHLVPPVA